MNRKSHLFFIFAALMLIVQACNMPGSVQPTEPPPIESPAAQHQTIPISAPDAKSYPDVVSSDTAPEKRAPYGDSFDLNRLERPFTEDMTYVPDLDITAFSISADDDWYYVSMGLVGKDPNNPLGINYAVELDTNRDSFGDFLILAEPPYSEEWTAANIRVYKDTNRDTAGLSASKSDAPFDGDGYDELIHDTAAGIGDDADLAWVRINAGPFATVQFAFKKSFAGGAFLYGVLADGGLKDVTRLDYVDYFTEREAGSPIRRNDYYPLKALYAVDNTCFQAFGFSPTSFEPKICPVIVQPQVIENQPGPPPVSGCQPPPGGCGSLNWYPEPFCVCFE